MPRAEPVRIVIQLGPTLRRIQSLSHVPALIDNLSIFDIHQFSLKHAYELVPCLLALTKKGAVQQCFR